MIVQQDCHNMISTVWREHVLSMPMSTEVIKPLFKKGERSLLKNWRPITLLTLSYKIITKILANHIQPLMPKLVDPQQTRFHQRAIYL